MKVMKTFIGFMIFSTVLVTNARGAVIYEQGINNVFGGTNTYINRFAYDDFTLGTGYTLDKITINAFAHLDRFHRAEIRDMDWEHPRWSVV